VREGGSLQNLWLYAVGKRIESLDSEGGRFSTGWSNFVALNDSSVREEGRKSIGWLNLNEYNLRTVRRGR
jgi:hypothetical protein